MPIIRHAQTQNFTALPNALLRDERLELRDRGLLCFCLSLPSDWQFSVEGLCAVLHAGRDGIKASLRRIERAGYLTRVQQRDEHGKLSGSEWIFSDQPQTEAPSTAQPSAANPQQRKNISKQKNDLNKGRIPNERAANCRRDSAASSRDGAEQWQIVYDA